MFWEEIVKKVEPGVKRYVKAKVSAKKNLFLETGWYRPNYRIPVSTKGFFCFKKGYLVFKRWSIEAPKPSDARAIAAFQANAWLETYSQAGDTARNMQVARDAEAFLSGARIHRRRAIIERIHRGSDTEYMRIGRAGVVAALLYGTKEDAIGQELRALYVHSSFHGKGLAQEITEGYIDWCDDRPIDVGVDTQNHKAQRFYRKMGFEDTGTRRPFNSYITEMLMRRE